MGKRFLGDAEARRLLDEGQVALTLEAAATATCYRPSEKRVVMKFLDVDSGVWFEWIVGGAREANHIARGLTKAAVHAAGDKQRGGKRR